MIDMSTDPHRIPLVADLAVLVAVAEQGGVGAAARHLGMAQPNVSRALRRLERHLRVDLVERRPRGATLTSDGTLVVDWARRVLDANDRLLEGVQALTTDRSPSVTVVASQTIAEELLPRWLATLSAQRPDTKVALAVGNSHEVGRRVSQGPVIGFIESPDLPASLTVEVDTALITTDRLVVVVAPGHDWARRTRPVSIEELAATRLVVREPGSGTRIALAQALGQVSMAPPALELEGNAAVRVAVAAGAAPAVLSEHAVLAAVQAGELRAVMVDGLEVERPLRAIWDRARPPSGAAARLVEIAVAVESTRAGTGLGGRPVEPAIDYGWGL